MIRPIISNRTLVLSKPFAKKQVQQKLQIDGIE
jgi:hypothetical protein